MTRRRHRAVLSVERLDGPRPFAPFAIAIDAARDADRDATLGRRARRAIESDEDGEELPDEPPPGYARS